MLTTPISEGRLPNRGVPFPGVREFGHLTASKLDTAGRRQPLADADLDAKAASTRGGSFKRVLPLNTAAQADARAGVVLCKGQLARAAGCER
jgi:hypothetical protein